MHTMLRSAIFVVASLPILAVSWRPLRNPRCHGFYRFFAFEFILVLVLLNAPGWFRDPFSPRQLVSWLLLLISTLLPIVGFSSLRRIGRPKGGIERTTVLVTTGVYRHLRHPLYASLVYGALGVFLKRPSLTGGALALATGIFTFLTAWVEEREMLSKFGPAYAAYMKRTARFVPFVF
jgi:protein-S-isoprenylcysteine O-methyltransferase Ste14